MSVKDRYFEYLDHIGRSVTLRELHEDPHRPDAIALRHDIDHDLDLALEVAHREHERGLRATYFLLHTHEYWHDEQFLDKCRQLEAYGHEVGLHLNVLTEWMAGACDDVDGRLREILAPLREAGLTIAGVSAHGDRACYEGQFANGWIWRELRGDDPAAAQKGRSAEGVAVNDAQWHVAYPPAHQLTRADGAVLALWSSSLAEHGLAYEAMRVPVDHYWTDTGGRWTRSDDPMEADLSRGRHQILIHPHWWRGAKRLCFVLSTARCGTKWLANFVDRATSCRGLHEWTLNHRNVDGEMVADKRTNEDYVALIDDAAGSMKLIEQAMSHLRGLTGDVLEVNVYLEPYAHLLTEMGEDIAIIHLHRDGRDVVRSLLNRGWYDTPHDRRHRIVPIEDWDELTQFERCCWYWRFTNDHLAATTDRRLRFETMVGDLGALTAALAEQGIVVHPLLADEEFPRRLNEATSWRFPPHGEWTPSQRQVFQRICGPVQEALGYPTEPSPTSSTMQRPGWREAAEPTVLLKIDEAGARRAARRFSAKNVSVTVGASGIVLRTDKEGIASSHVLLARGSWHALRPRRGHRADPRAYYVGQVQGAAAPGAAARIFVIFYDRSGQRFAHEHVGGIHGDAPATTFSFRAADEATHFALALHLGEQHPQHAVSLKSLTLRAIPIGPAYRAMSPTAGEPVS